jgi:hypothetical protein
MEDNLIIDVGLSEPRFVNDKDLVTEEPEIPQQVNADAILKDTPLSILFAELNSGKHYPSNEIVDKLFAAMKVAFGNCWNAALPEVAMIHFNQTGLAFSILQKILMTRHGVLPPEQMPQQQKSNLIQL